MKYEGERAENTKDGKNQENPKYNKKNEQPAADRGYIGEAKAKSAALSHAGLDNGSITEYECKLDREDGRMVYEIDFKCNGFEYEYEIDAVSGAIVKQDKDIDD